MKEYNKHDKYFYLHAEQRVLNLTDIIEIARWEQINKIKNIVNKIRKLFLKG